MASRRSLLATVGAAITAGCTLTGPEDGSRRESALPHQARVTMACTGGDEYVFDPPLVHIREGGTVSWRGGATCRQLCTAYHPQYDRPRRIPTGTTPWQGPDRRQGTITQAFPEAGVYDYFGLYESFGQVGSVIVGRPTATAQPGLAPPQSSIPAPARTTLRTLNERTRRLLGES